MVVLLILIYFGDKIEKEPVGLVFALLGMGVLSIIPAVICEWIGEFVLQILFRQDSVIYNFFLYFFVVAVAEELFKFLFMFSITWKNRHFDYVIIINISKHLFLFNRFNCTCAMHWINTNDKTIND